MVTDRNDPSRYRLTIKSALEVITQMLADYPQLMLRTEVSMAPPWPIAN